MLVGDSSQTFVERAFGLFSICENYRCGTAPDFDRTSPVFQLATTAGLHGLVIIQSRWLVVWFGEQHSPHLLFFIAGCMNFVHVGQKMLNRLGEWPSGAKSTLATGRRLFS